jgi:P27 family predicted phage terminase small subunit
MAPPKKPAGTQQGHRETPTLTLVPETSGRAVPNPPDGLLPQSVERWESFWRSDVSQAVDVDADLHALQRWIRYVDQYERTVQLFAAEPMVEGSQGQPRLSPLAQIVKDCEAAIQKFEAQFGMTLKSRIDLGVSMGQAQLTAAQVNKMIQAPNGPEPVADLEEFASEYEEA